jgi:hypothetical protein
MSRPITITSPGIAAGNHGIAAGRSLPITASPADHRRRVGGQISTTSDIAADRSAS